MAVKVVEDTAPSRLVFSLRSVPNMILAGIQRNYRWIVHVIGLLPLALIVYKGVTSGLTANPIQFLTFRTGKAALIMVVLTLACTPLNTLFHFREALKARRTFGLYTFLYVLLHVLIFVGLDYVFDLKLIVDTVLMKRYILAGLSAFLIFLPLAVTSFDWWKKRLGKNWKRLHRLVYLGALLAVVHYTWQVKSDIRVPLLYGAGIVILLIMRIPVVRRTLANLKFRRPA